MGDNGNGQVTTIDIPALDLNAEIPDPTGMALELARATEKLCASLTKIEQGTLTPVQELAELERLQINAGHLVGKSWGVIWLAQRVIKKKGLWRFAQDARGQAYRRWDDYVTATLENIQHVSKGVAYERLNQMERMDDLGVPIETQAALLTNSPSILTQALNAGEWSPAGEFEGLSPARRKDILTLMGVEQDEAQALDDKQVLSQFVRELEGMPVAEAGSAVGEVTQVFKRRLRYLPEDHILVLQVFRYGEKKCAGQFHFRLVDKASSVKGQARNELEAWLRGLSH